MHAHLIRYGYVSGIQVVVYIIRHVVVNTTVSQAAIALANNVIRLVKICRTSILLNTP